MVDKVTVDEAELVIEQVELLRHGACLKTLREKLLEEGTFQHAENEELIKKLKAENAELIQKLNNYKSIVKEFIMTKATMEYLNMTSVSDYILYVNEALVACEVGLKERRLILPQKLPQKYASLLKIKDYSDGQRLKKAIVRIEKQLHIAEGHRWS